ncbi:hypothetical protein TWF696_009530 [Orbilia brochopaga]|uniref:Uncharacterized protein n=1 Tax=Orbilia brochopaga TaxID=3140254 RepID=A0AAV9UF30_9PEZI
MVNYILSIVVFGDGNNPAPWEGSHWGLAIERQGGSGRGELHNVVLIDNDRKWYQYEMRDDVTILNLNSEGKFWIAILSEQQKRDAVKVISKEAPPRDGKKGCQDWVMDCLFALETNEPALIPDGTSQFVYGLVRTPASNIAKQAGERWEPRA